MIVCEHLARQLFGANLEELEMRKLILASAAGLAILTLGGAAWASCSDCKAACNNWYPDDYDLRAACLNGCAMACLPQ